MRLGASAVARSLRQAGNFMLPAACLGCRVRLPLEPSNRLVCGACLTRLRPLPEPACSRCGFPTGTGVLQEQGCLECAGWDGVLAGGRSAFELRPPADALVHALKYGGWQDVASVMGRRMARMDLGVRGRWEGIVVPVPTTSGRRRRRGYNQAERLAHVVAMQRGLPMVEALIRSGRSGTQVSLHPTQRRANVDKVFRASSAQARRVAGHPVLLVDDVLTTGATIIAAARALHDVGVGRVFAITFARALPFQQDRDTK